MAKKQDRYLHKRGNTYYFRKKHNGKTFKRSLNTTDKQTARDLRNFYLGNLLEYGQLDAPVDKHGLITFGEVVGWVQNMLGHSSLQMIFQRYYAWIPKKTRSDGQAFLRYAEGEAKESQQDAKSIEVGKPNLVDRCTNLVPLDEYRRKKRA